MPTFPDASGPPYPYPQPLPPDAEGAHLRATGYYQKKINRWNGLVLFPGILCAIISLYWGRGRSAEHGDPSLWDINLDLALILLLVGVALILIAGIRIYVLASAKSPHTKLLKAYGVPLDASGTKKLKGERGRAR